MLLKIIIVAALFFIQFTNLSAQMNEKNYYLSISPYFRNHGAGLLSYNVGVKLAIPIFSKLFVTPELGFQWNKIHNTKNVYAATVFQYFLKPDYKGLYIKAGAHYDFKKYDVDENKKIWEGGLGYNFKISPNSRLGLDAGVIMGSKEGEYYYGISYIINPPQSKVYY